MDKEEAIERDNRADLQRLQEAVEQELGQKILNPKDFVYLSESIAQRMHQTIGVNTLKRIWGRLDDNVTPRISTLNLLAQFVGAESWDAFCRSDVPSVDDGNSNGGYNWLLPALIAVFVILGGVLGVNVYHTYHYNVEEADSQYQLQKGQRFATYDDYLQLFGLVNVKEYPYYQIHPKYPYIVLWGPEYHNAHWHNDGDALQMMPTITERWEPADTIPELVIMRNQELYYNGRRNRDIRLTFMKGLDGYPGFVFLGAYRFSLTQSDTTHIVWERVAEEIDLRHIDALSRFR